MQRKRFGNEIPHDPQAIADVSVEVDRGHFRVFRRTSLGSILLRQQPRREQRDGSAGGALFLSLFPGNARDVQVRPIVFLGELGEEARRGDASAGAAADVGEIRKIAGERFVIVLPEWKLPSAIEGFLASIQKRPRQAVAVAEHAAGDVPHRDDHRAGQRSDIDHRCWLVALGVGQCVAQDQPAFGVRVEDLDRLSRHALDDVTRLGRASAGHVFARRNEPDEVDLRLELGDGAKRAEHARRAAHVEFHVVHIETGLERNAAAVEGDAFSDQHDWLLLLARARVFEHDEFRRLFAAAGYREERTHLELLELIALEDLAVEAQLPGKRLRALGEMARRADVPGEIAEVARDVHSVRNRKAARGGGLAVGEIATLRDREGELAQGPSHLGRLALHLIESIHRFHGDYDGVLDPPGYFATLDLFLGQVNHRFVRAGFVQQPDRRADRAAEFALAKVAFLPEPDQQHAIGKRPANVVQQQRAAELPLHVAAADDFTDVSSGGAVDQLGGKARLAIVENPHHDAGAALLLRAAAFYGKFHRRSSNENLPLGGTNRIIGKSALKSQNISLSWCSGAAWYEN